jgi:hypothetical protein
MIINSNTLNFKDFPNIPCPKCGKGVLAIINETLFEKHPSWIRNMPIENKEYRDENGEWHREISYWDIEGTAYEEFVTSFFLECNRKQCKEIVVTCGKTKIDYEYEAPLLGENEPYQSEVYNYYPRIFVPAIRLFNIPERTPSSIISELENSFMLYWVNPSACGNSIRKVIEKIIDELEGKSNNKLHKRIENLGTNFSEIKTFLLASKWIGNDGSHESELEYYDVILAFEFIEKCLIERYEEQRRDLNSIAQKINLHKKPISKISLKE